MIEVTEGWAVYNDGELVFSAATDKWRAIGPAIEAIMGADPVANLRNEHFGTGSTACACGEVFSDATILGRHIARKRAQAAEGAFEIAAAGTLHAGERTEVCGECGHSDAVTGCPCDVCPCATAGLRKIKVRVAIGRKVRTLTYQTAQHVELNQEVQVPRWPGMPKGDPLRGTVVSLTSDREGPLVTLIGG